MCSACIHTARQTWDVGLISTSTPSHSQAALGSWLLPGRVGYCQHLNAQAHVSALWPCHLLCPLATHSPPRYHSGAQREGYWEYKLWVCVPPLPFITPQTPMALQGPSNSDVSHHVRFGHDPRSTYPASLLLLAQFHGKKTTTQKTKKNNNNQEQSLSTQEAGPVPPPLPQDPDKQPG